METHSIDNKKALHVNIKNLDLFSIQSIYRHTNKGGISMELKLNEKYMLTIKEAAAYYGIGMKFLRRCAENGESKFSVICGNRVMIIKDKFEEYLYACSESGKPFGDFVDEEFDNEVESWKE